MAKSGSKFKALQGSVAQGYMKKGMSIDKANAIGAAVAAKQGRKKFGKAKFQKMAVAGRHPADNFRKKMVNYNG